MNIKRKSNNHPHDRHSAFFGLQLLTLSEYVG